MIFVKILTAVLYVLGFILIVPGLSGLWVITGANLLAYILSRGEFPLSAVLISAGLSAVSELLDIVFGILGAKKAKASKLSIILSFVFALAFGAVFTPLIPVIGGLMGVFLGTFAGCFLGEFLFYRKNAADSGRAGMGALAGRMLSVMTKLVFAFIIIFIGVKALFF